jgi:cytochrome c oxidase subunit 2
MIVCLSGLSVRQAAAQDVARGEQLFSLCGQCHGANGEGNEMFGGPALAGMDQWYVEVQLRNFQAGLRGAHPDDVMGLRMRPMSRTLELEGDISAVSAYIAGLPKVEPQKTLSGGNPDAGKTSYVTCAACHGAKGEGNKALNGPALVDQADWYLAGQLEKFKTGVRGGNTKNINAVMMRPMALALPNEQAIKDVVAYIETLSE